MNPVLAVALAVVAVAAAAVCFLKGKVLPGLAGLLGPAVFVGAFALGWSAGDRDDGMGFLVHMLPYTAVGVVIGAPLLVSGVVRAVRLALPGSWWARRFYGPGKMGHAEDLWGRERPEGPSGGSPAAKYTACASCGLLLQQDGPRPPRRCPYCQTDPAGQGKGGR